MGHVLKRKTSTGEIRYRASVRFKKGGAIVHQECQTFPQLAPAKAWIAERETFLRSSEGALELARQGLPKGALLGDLIQRYIKENQVGGRVPWGRSKSADLQRLAKALPDLDVAQLGTKSLLGHVLKRRREGAAPPTVGNDLIWLKVVCEHARLVWELPVNIQPIADAQAYARKEGWIGKAKLRERRATVDEMEALLTHFRRGDGRCQTPHADIIEFALLTARRQDEICRLRFSDLDEKALTIQVRDVKHPRRRLGNNMVAKLLPEALEIIKRQPRTGDIIFPYESRTLSAAFTRACHLLGISGLCFHDLRHEATSRLFERGYQIHEVCQFTLHRDWKTLQRYTHLKPKDVRILHAPTTQAQHL